MQRYNTGLYVVLGISIILLMLWGVDLSRSVADEPSAGPYRAEVNVWTDGPFVHVLQKTWVVDHIDDDCMIIFRSQRGMLILEREAHPVDLANHQIHLSRLPGVPSTGGCVILVTLRAADNQAERPGNREISVQEILIGGAVPREKPPTQINLLVSHPFGGWF